MNEKQILSEFWSLGVRPEDWTGAVNWFFADSNMATAIKIKAGQLAIERNKSQPIRDYGWPSATHRS